LMFTLSLPFALVRVHSRLTFAETDCLWARNPKNPRMAKSANSKFAAYPRLNPLGIGKDIPAADLIDQAFLAYNAGRLREAAKLLTEKMLPSDGFIGMSLTGALTPAGLGKSCLIQLMKAGLVDWSVSTGAE